jgi:hypothetical protein
MIFFPRLVMIFQGNQPHRDCDQPKKRQCNGQPVTVTIAPLQLDTVISLNNDLPKFEIFSNLVAGEQN